MSHDSGEHQTTDSNSKNLPDICNVNNENRPILPSASTSNFQSSKSRRLSSWSINIVNDPDYAEIIKEAERAIEHGVLPVRIAVGSSGSYFVRNCEGKNIGVFKPKDEEPYARFNPKWSKWIQRNLFPCCFGRGCLVNNQGYLSEAGASIIDEKLRLNIVPKTHVVRLTAESFNYPAHHRLFLTTKRRTNVIVDRHMPGKRIFALEGLRSKVGSFQLFVDNYISADDFIKQLEEQPLPGEAMEKFQKQFEKLVVLDYIIRNTDRNNDNWLVKYDVKPSNKRDELLQSLANQQIRSEKQVEGDVATSSSKTTSIKATNTNIEIRIAAIDNGLAFPFKHPDEWRAYPFHWAWLKQAKIPFSEEIKSQILPFISDMSFVQHELCDEIERLFALDKNYNRRLVERQLSVMRGQIFNLAQAMRDGKSPVELVHMPGVLVERVRDHRLKGRKKFKKKFNDRYPLFSWF
ncbi:unnamed protein product [Rotaria magnacalcarata]|uniref:Phosphatidylinositol 4-kinase type 2 n=1 Tax=Rotaria magnacalcarata TaxID=392030 RepID=A0A815QYE7_9BILA|nr:unnamed protein product [Rotaria magnacalcarata]CAF2070840.1 unnamed protein product [Rotaria magnacalcarata]